MAAIISLSDDRVAEDAAKAVLSAGGLVIYPTDTLYGLGCNALSQGAVDRLYGIKKRDAGKPLSIIVSDYQMLQEYCEISGAQEKVLQALLPGPYTFILPLREKLPVSPTLQAGIRVPEHIFMRQVCRELGFPVVSTSANLSGKRDAAEVSELDREVMGKVDLVVDGGRCSYAQGSTVIDLVQMKVLRKGAVREGDRFEF